MNNKLYSIGGDLHSLSNQGLAQGVGLRVAKHNSVASNFSRSHTYKGTERGVNVTPNRLYAENSQLSNMLMPLSFKKNQAVKANLMINTENIPQSNPGSDNNKSETEAGFKPISGSLFSGTGTFAVQKRFTEERDMPRKERLQAANTLAKLRFNIGLEKAKKTEILKQIEEQEVLEMKEQRLQAESRIRKSNLAKATNLNLKMHAEVKEKFKKEKEDWYKEKDNLQTSLKSKKEDDANENFKINKRRI